MATGLDLAKRRLQRAGDDEGAAKAMRPDCARCVSMPCAMPLAA
jgi:hypothetical protein